VSHATKRPEDDPAVRRIADLLGTGAPEPIDGDDDGLPHDGPLRLDKTGALVGRPKLEPVKAWPSPEGLGPEGLGPGGSAPAEAPRPETAKAKRAAVPPRLEGLAKPARTDPRVPAPDEVAFPAGRFLFGEQGEPREIGSFAIDRYPVTHASYAAFVAATRHRPPLYWPGGRCPEELADHPVVGVDYYDALAYAFWCGKDLPFEDEWERAARGPDGSVYPWGDDPSGDANTARLGLKCTLPVGWHEGNVTAEGVHDMAGNVWQMTHSPAPGGGIVVRGGSWYDFALYAKSWFRFASRPDARNGTIGFRCVRRKNPRDALREVAPEDVDVEIQRRRVAAGAGAASDEEVAAFSAERRDLVPDLRRLRHMRSERLAEIAERPPAARPDPKRPSRARPASKAAVPPPLRAPAPEEAAPARTPAPPEPVTRAAPANRVVVEPPRSPGAPSDRTASQRPAPPGWRWIQGLGLLAAAGLLALLLANMLSGRGKGASGDGERAGTSRPAARPTSAVSRLPGAPPLGPADQAPPTFLDGAVPGEWARRMGDGVRLVVFTDRVEDRATVAAAADLHRRLRGQSLGVLLVLPRKAFEAADGRLADPERRRRTLADLGAATDLTVLLDPGSAGGPRALYGLHDPVVAVVIARGRLEHRITPFEPGFTLEELAPLALQGLAHGQ
jgi:hypothetical protein